MSFNQNPNGPRGFSVYRAGRGTPQRLTEYEIAGDYGTKIHSGGPVSLVAAGTIEVPADVDARILGVFQGCEYVDTNGEFQFKSYWPAPGSVKSGTVVKALVDEAAGEQFLIKADGDLSQSDVGEYFALTALSGGDDATGRSSVSLDASTNGTDVVDKTVKLRQIAKFEGTVQLAVVSFIRPENPETEVFPATA